MTQKGQYPNRFRTLLREAGLTMREIHRETAIPESTLYYWAAGHGVIPKGDRATLAQLIGCLPHDLAPKDEQHMSLPVPPDCLPEHNRELHVVSEILSLLTSQGLLAPLSETKNPDVNTLRRLLLLGTSGLVAEAPIAVEEFLLQCESGLKACWYLLRGKGLIIAEEMLSRYIPTLTKLTLSLSKFQETAASLATQAKILQAVIAMHKLNFVGREMFCQEAIQYGQLCGDAGLQAAGLMYLANTYVYCPPKRPKKAVPIFLEGLRVLGDDLSLLKSDIYLGLGVAQAQCGEEQQVLEVIELAQAHFPRFPEQDPSYLYADCGWFELHSDIGKMYLELARHYPDRKYYEKADEVFTRLAGSQSTSERTTDETIIRQAETACGLGDLDRYVSYLEQGTHMAFLLGSQKRYNEAFAVFQQTPEKWRKEQKIQKLAKEVFQSSERRMG